MRLLTVIHNQDRQLMDLLERGLRTHGFIVEVVSNHSEARRRVAANTYCVIIIASGPGADDADLCRALRKQPVKAPLLMLLPGDSVEKRVAALNAGADDCLAIPFEFDELVARIWALLRRGKAGEASILRYADLELDLTRHVARRGGKLIALTPQEFALLHLLLHKAEQVVCRTNIGQQVWDRHLDIESNCIDVCIHNLRRKIDAGFDPPLIQTVPGVGYAQETRQADKAPPGVRPRMKKK